jgi:hypothetical protein
VSSRLAAGDPGGGDVLTVYWLAPVATLALLGDVIDSRFPTRHVEILIGDLAVYLDTKDDSRESSSFQQLATDHAMRLAAFAAEYNLDASALEFAHADVTRVAPKSAGV